MELVGGYSILSILLQLLAMAEVAAPGVLGVLMAVSPEVLGVVL